MREWKKVRIEYQRGLRRRQAITRKSPKTIQLSGVTPETRLTPRLAEQAALIACGNHNGVTVWDNEYQHGYRLYANSARKLTS